MKIYGIYDLDDKEQCLRVRNNWRNNKVYEY